MLRPSPIEVSFYVTPDALCFTGHFRIIVVLFVRHRAILSDVFFWLGHRIASYYPCYITPTATRTSVGGIFEYFELYTLWLIFFCVRLIVDVSRSPTISHTHNRFDSSDRVISSSQRPLPAQHAKDTRDEHPCLNLDSNPRSRQSSGFRPTP